MHCTSVYLFFFLFGHVEVPQEVECDTPRAWGAQGPRTLRRPGQQGSSSSAQLCRCSRESRAPPEELSFKMFLCVQGAFPPARENSSKKAPASEVRHRSHLAESSAGSPPEKCCLLHRPEGPVCGSSAYLKILSSHFFQFCVFHKFSSFSWWIVLAVWFLEVGIYCFVPHKMEAGILWMAQPGWANFSRLTRNYYYYYYFKEQFCGSVVMLLP